jgi:hypothetical protein
MSRLSPEILDALLRALGREHQRGATDGGCDPRRLKAAHVIAIRRIYNTSSPTTSAETEQAPTPSNASPK